MGRTQHPMRPSEQCGHTTPGTGSHHSVSSELLTAMTAPFRWCPETAASPLKLQEVTQPRARERTVCGHSLRHICSVMAAQMLIQQI